jgi:hypothetical protein
MSSGLATDFSLRIVPMVVAIGRLKMMEFTCSISIATNMNSNISGKLDAWQMMRE